MSGPYGYGGYGGYASGGYGGGYPPRPGYPPGQPAAGPRPGFPPGQPGPQGYQQAPGYRGPSPQPGYGMPGYRAPGAQQQPPQGYTPANTQGGYGPAGYGPPQIAPGQAPVSNSQPRGPILPGLEGYKHIDGNIISGTSPKKPERAPMYGQRPAPPQQQYGQHHRVAIPDSFPELQNMSPEELQKLLDDESALIELFEDRDDVQQLQRERQQLVENNEKLAQENIALKPELEQKQQELIELYSQLEEQRNSLNELQQKQQNLANHYAPHNILARLKIAASEVEEESEAISENFLNGDLAIEEFLKSYIPKKALCHSRRAKEEKMEKMGI